MTTTATRPSISSQMQGTRPLAVSLHGVSKSFKLPHRQYHTLKERALHPFQSRTFDVLEAVKDVNVEIAQGEFFGIIGRNGSGKSTLLKCIAGIYNADAGEHHGARPAVAVHRAGRRLQPGADAPATTS